MKRIITRTAGKRWCRVEMEVKNGRFSLHGSYGEILRQHQAEDQALEYWQSFFEDNPEELGSVVSRFPGNGIDSPDAAAEFVIENDGVFHGLDVEAEHGDFIYVAHGGGQCREEINEWFPEVKSLWKWHLNDMHAECVHQEALGWTWITHPNVVCPAFFCRYGLGSAWRKRQLPRDIQHTIANIC